jgi:hypothetical protein
MLVGALALAVGLAMAAPPALAGQPPSMKPGKTPLAASASSPSFFKTPKGIAVLVLIAAGVGYTAYSAVHDRQPVKSPIR